MKKQISIVKFIKLWGTIFLITSTSLFVVIDIVLNRKNLNNRIKEVRFRHIKNQKELIKNEVFRVVNLIRHEKEKSEELAKKNSKERVYEAYSIVLNIYNQNKKTKSKSEIKKMILDALRPIRFNDGNGYYFINTDSGITLLYPTKPHLEGKSILNLKNTKGSFSAKKEYAVLGSKNETFVTSFWQKPNSKNKKDFKKITFLKRFKPFNWIIGSGIYIDDIEKQIQENLLSIISSIRFGKNGYIFVNRLNGDALVANGRQFDGSKKLWEIFNKNPKATKSLFKKEYDAALKRNGDYIFYSFVKLKNSNKKSPKSSFIYGIKEWQWLIGAGVYLDDIEKEISAMQTHLINDTKNLLVSIITVIIILVIFFYVLSNWVSKKIKKDMLLFFNFFEKLTLENEKINEENIYFKEFNNLAKNANIMLENKINAERNLLNEKERLFVTLRSIGDGVISTDISGKIVFMNNVAENLIGYSTESVKGENLTKIFNIVNEKTNEVVKNPVMKVLETGSIVGLANHTKLISKDGTEYQIADSASPIKSENGEIIGVVLVFRNVSKEYQMLKALQESEAKFRALIEQSPISVQIFNPNGLTITANKAWEDLWKSPANKIIGKYNALEDKSIQGTKWFEEFKKAFKGEVVSLPDLEYNPNDIGEIGRKRIIKCIAFPIKDKNKIIRVVIMHQDITEQRNAEKELVKSEAYNKALFQNSHIPLVVMDSKTYKFTDCNKVAIKIYGYEKKDELLGLTPVSVSTPTQYNGLDSSIVAKEKIAIAKKNGSVVFPWRHIRPNGEIWDAEVNLMSLTYKSKEILQFSLHDITLQKRAEKELQNMAKLKSVGTLAGGIAHDFNNLLTGVYGNISLAKNKILNNKSGIKYIEEAEKSMDRAINLTKQLLTFSKGGDPIKENIRIDKLIEEIITFDLSGSNVKLILKKDPNLWQTKADKGQIEQVFSNLAINANQAMPNGGHLFVTLKNIEISQNEIIGLTKGKFIKIIFKDEGVGISSKNLDKIFDPYFTTKQSGNGLGLATTYSIINRHDGHISLESKLGVGTTFTIYLPAIEIENIESKKIKTNALSTKKSANILVMDDEEIVCMVSQEMLEGLGYTSQIASDGKQAIEMYKEAIKTQKPFDVLIMDLTIPGGVGGKEAIKEILAINPKAKVIVSSGYAIDPVMANYKDYGFVGIMPKPYTIGKMKEILDEILDL